jgi:hypothetical protein
MRMDPPQPAELLPDLLLTGLVEHGDRISAVDQYQAAHLLGVLGGVAHRDRRAVRPPDEDRTFDIGRVDDASDVVNRRPYGVVGRRPRLPARPRVESHRAVLLGEASDDVVPVLHGAEAGR